jgi:hypothetical protein
VIHSRKALACSKTNDVLKEGQSGSALMPFWSGFEFLPRHSQRKEHPHSLAPSLPRDALSRPGTPPFSPTEFSEREYRPENS